MTDIKMLGRVQVEGRITLRSGLHIGAGNDGVEIGGVDNPVIRHPHTNEPYIPGSSLKGKLRFLLEWAFDKVRGDGKPWGADDRAENATHSDADPILRTFGNALKNWRAGPTRLLMEDCPLVRDWVKETLEAGHALTEEKTEVLINRIEGRAYGNVGPRQTERVPAGAIFDFGFAFRLFDTGDGGKRDRACLNWVPAGARSARTGCARRLGLPRLWTHPLRGPAHSRGWRELAGAGQRVPRASVPSRHPGSDLAGAMNPLLRARLRLTTPLGTPLSSGTLFGHLVWALRARQGAEAAQHLIDRLDVEPFALSDGLPAGFLPRPVLPPDAPAREAPPARLTEQARRELEAAKERRRVRLLPRAEWIGLRVGMTERRVDERLRARSDTERQQAQRTTARRITHNTIDRRSGHTPEEGGLWFVDDTWHAGAAAEIDLYIRAAMPEPLVCELLRDVGAEGYGRDAALGRGRFRLEGTEPAPELDDAPPSGGGRRWLSLSSGTISANMQGAHYRRFVHYGKVAKAALADAGSPWKKPLLLALPGMTFCAEDEGAFGAWLDGLHPARPEIGHNAFHVAIPFTHAEASA